MQKHYIQFNDILLTDTTYSTNHFSIPLVILSGVDENDRNILFGIALINDETLLTYSYSSFFFS